MNRRTVHFVLAGAAAFVGCSHQPDKPTLANALAIIQSKPFVDLTHAFEPGISHWPGFPDEKQETIYWYDGNKGTMGTDAIDRHGNVYQQSPEVARILTRMAASAGRVFVLADGSKLGKTALWRFGRLADWAALVTDSAADGSLLASLKRAGVRVIKAG
jgi:hypothetical protein